MASIRVPKPPKTAYNPQRVPGTLLQSQLKHLEWAARPAAERPPGKLVFTPAKTEAEAAARIEQLTSNLHRKTAGREPIADMWQPKTRAPRHTSKSKPRRRMRR